MILEVDGLKLTYNSHDILRGVGLKVPSGEVLAVLGPNGAGKTTLLRCIHGILRPRAGSVRVSGRNVFSMQPAEIARNIAYVAQRIETCRLTAFDAILMGRRPHMRWRASKEDLRRVDAAMNCLDLQPLAMRYIDRMSGGELQKVAIARCLVQEPRLLLLDEPTSSLDLRNQVEILKTIHRLVSEHGVAAVITMHDLNTALRFSHKCIFLKEGSIHFAGSVQEVTAEVVQAVYGLPVEICRHRGYPLVVPIEAG